MAKCYDGKATAGEEALSRQALEARLAQALAQAKQPCEIRQTTLCYMERDGQYLMLHRVSKAHDASHGKWIGIGGKCERDESPDECMVREVREETGLVVRQWRYRGIVTFISDVWPCEYMHLFTTHDWGGEQARHCDEGVLRWVDKQDVLNLPLWEGDKVFLRLLMDEQHPFFSLKLVYRGDALEQVVLDGRRQ